MSATNLLDSNKGQNFLPPPAIFLSEATSDGEDTADETTDRGPKLVKCDAVLTDVEYSSDEDVDYKKCASPIAVNCSSESQVVERVFAPKTHDIVDELTDTENLYASDDDLLASTNNYKESEIDAVENGITSISDQVKTNVKSRNRFGPIPKNVDVRRRTDCCAVNSSKKINRTDQCDGRNYLAPSNKLAKKKKRKGKMLLDSCLTDTEDVDVPSDVDDINRVVKKDVSYTLFPSEKEEQDYTNRIKQTFSEKGSEKYTLLEFLTDKVDDGGVTDTDDIAYSDVEDMLDVIKETEYELDFSNETSNRETFNSKTDRRLKKKRSNKSDSSVYDTDEEKYENKSQRSFSEGSPGNNLLAVGKRRGLGSHSDTPSSLTDTEDLYYSDGDCFSTRPKCPTPDIAFYDDSTVSQNEKLLTVVQALEALSDVDPITDSEDLLLTSPRKTDRCSKRRMKISNPSSSDRHADGLTDTEELFLSDGNVGYSDLSETGADSCSETDVEICSNIGDIDDVRGRAPSITPDCIRNMDNTYISNIEGSDAYLKQVKSNKSQSLSVPPSRRPQRSQSPVQDTDSEDIQTEDETAEEFTYNRACTPSNYFEKFNLEDESCVIHEKNTRCFQMDGAESLHIKDPSYQLQDPLTDSEDIPLLD